MSKNIFINENFVFQNVLIITNVFKNDIFSFFESFKRVGRQKRSCFFPKTKRSFLKTIGKRSFSKTINNPTWNLKWL